MSNDPFITEICFSLGFYYIRTTTSTWLLASGLSSSPSSLQMCNVNSSSLLPKLSAYLSFCIFFFGIKGSSSIHSFNYSQIRAPHPNCLFNTSTSMTHGSQTHISHTKLVVFNSKLRPWMALPLPPSSVSQGPIQLFSSLSSPHIQPINKHYWFSLINTCRICPLLSISHCHHPKFKTLSSPGLDHYIISSRIHSSLINTTARFC